MKGTINKIHSGSLGSNSGSFKSSLEKMQSLHDPVKLQESLNRLHCVVAVSLYDHLYLLKSPGF